MTGKTEMRQRTVVVNVTEESVRDAMRADSGHCMIADAIKRDYPNATAVAVDLATIRFSDRKKGERYVYLTPAAAQAALVRFDQGEEVAPFRVSIRLAQVTPIVSAKNRLNLWDRPSTAGKPKLRKPVTGSAPVKEGGAAPPVGALSNSRGRRREYGLRQLRK